ncbi:DUF2203 domain-containing protein [Paenibacillus sp. sgz302251]|uniref:DUF2203 domain-containing protein n=1 Tax=Paenibacillus sp. sgz302251 TaxID=3414493 RepID=UPI003C7A0E6E
MENKRFTRSEANALLPQLKADLRQLQQVMEQFEDLHTEYQMTKATYKQAHKGSMDAQDPFFEMESKLDFMKIETDLLIENFSRKGVLLKMIKPGLLDFPAMLDGEEILICWKEGEDEASHYHGWHDGFIGRKPFPEA